MDLDINMIADLRNCYPDDDLQLFHQSQFHSAIICTFLSKERHGARASNHRRIQEITKPSLSRKRNYFYLLFVSLYLMPGAVPLRSLQLLMYSFVRWPTGAVQKYLFQHKNIYSSTKIFIAVQKYLFQYKNIFPIQKYFSSTNIRNMRLFPYSFAAVS